MEKKPVKKVATKKQTKRKPVQKPKNKVGRPPIYKTPEEMQEKINEYFKSREPKLLVIDGIQIYNKDNTPTITPQLPLSIEGLSYYLGFASSRKTLLDYENKEEFSYTVSRAKLFIQSWTADGLHDRNTVQGCKFILMNCYKEYKDREETESRVVIIDNL